MCNIAYVYASCNAAVRYTDLHTTDKGINSVSCVERVEIAVFCNNCSLPLCPVCCNPSTVYIKISPHFHIQILLQSESNFGLGVGALITSRRRKFTSRQNLIRPLELADLWINLLQQTRLFLLADFLRT